MVSAVRSWFAHAAEGRKESLKPLMPLVRWPRLPVAAPEVVSDADGALWLFALKPDLAGMRMARLTFEAPL